MITALQKPEAPFVDTEGHFIKDVMLTGSSILQDILFLLFITIGQHCSSVGHEIPF